MKVADCAPPSVQKVWIGNREMEAGSQTLGFFHDSTALLNDAQALQARMQEDGYLFLRGVHNLDKVNAARQRVLEQLDSMQMLDRSFPIQDGILAPNAKRDVYFGGKKELTHAPPLLALFESPEIMDFFARFLGQRPLTFDYKWLRSTGTGLTTKPHFDAVFMGRGSRNLYTCWTPLGDLALEQGPLAVLEGSHRLEGYRRVRETYGRADVDRDNINGNFSDDPLEIVQRYGGRWVTGEFRRGDALIFTMHTMHASLRNETHRYRLSSDTRYQPAGEPADERWVGQNPIANYGWGKTPSKPIVECRQEWGV